MIPYILAAIGGYLIVDSMKESDGKYANGGVMTDIAEIDVEVEKVIPDKSIDVSVIISYDDEANSEKKYFFEIMLSEDGYSIYKGKDSEGKTLSKEEIEMFENNEYFNDKISDAIEDYQDDDDDDYDDDDDNYAKGGKVKGAEIGDSARVVAENKSGVIMEKSKKKYFLKFADDTEGIYEESELEFTKQFAGGGEVATTILSQLGGSGRLNAMTGAYNFRDTGKGLSFKIKNAKANYIKIELNGKDLYDIEIGRIRGNTYKVVSEHKDVYFDQMKGIIEKGTGMYLSFALGGVAPKWKDSLSTKPTHIMLVPDRDKYTRSWGRVGEKNGMECVGAFDVKMGTKKWDANLFMLNDFDKDYWKNVKLKPNEQLFRYETYTTSVGGMMPVIKINLEKGLLYFNEDINSDDDKNLKFERVGIKPLYLSLNEKLFY